MYKKEMFRLLLLSLLFVACSKEEVCGTVQAGDVDRFTGQYYLVVDGQKEYVDMKTYDSFFVGDWVCLE